MTTETDYRTMVGYSNYRFTDQGKMINKNGREVGNNKHNNGYTITTLIRDDGKRVRRSTHRWIYEAWHGEIPQGTEISHKDDNKYNNAPSNLEAVSHKQNCNSGGRNKKISESLKKYYQNKKQLNK